MPGLLRNRDRGTSKPRTLSERSTTDKETDSELQAHMDEPLTDEEWLKIIDNNKKKKASKKKFLRSGKQTKPGPVICKACGSNC